MMKSYFLVVLVAIGVASVAASQECVPFVTPTAFPALLDQLLSLNARTLFGFGAPVTDAAVDALDDPVPYRDAGQTANDQVLLAGDLTVEYLTRAAADIFDQIVEYPAAAPTHLIGAVESRVTEDGSNPSVQAISLATGQVDTLVFGMERADAIRVTPWGSLLVGEEADVGYGGAAYEIFDPLSLIGAAVTITDRGGPADPATLDPPAAASQVVKLLALPTTIRWEGVAITAEGVVYAGDEVIPGEDRWSAYPDRLLLEDTDGGGIYKFIPDVLYTPGTVVTTPAQSPLAAGANFAMQVSCRERAADSGGGNVGEGCAVGPALWVPVSAHNARVDAQAANATGYLKPEDMDVDPLYTGAGIRFCWVNSGRVQARHYSEVLCAVDQAPTQAGYLQPGARFATFVNRFVEGRANFNQFDNIAFHPTNGQVYITEGGGVGVFACLVDRAADTLFLFAAAPCVRVLAIRDTEAEPTGILFDATGSTLYLAVQHSVEVPSSGLGDTDDILIVRGFAAVGQDAAGGDMRLQLANQWHPPCRGGRGTYMCGQGNAGE